MCAEADSEAGVLQLVTDATGCRKSDTEIVSALLLLCIEFPPRCLYVL